MKDFVLRSVCYFQCLNDGFMREVTHSLTHLPVDGGENCTTGLLCFCHISHTGREEDSFLAAFLLGAPLVSLLCMPWSLTQVKRKVKEVINQNIQVFTSWSSGLKGK